MKTWAPCLVSLLVVAVNGAGDEPAASGDPGNGLTWMQPPPIAPFARNGPIRGQLPGGGLRTAAPPGGQLASLRAVSLREGSATVVLGGESRALRPGDRVGAATVKSIGADRIILEQAQTTSPTGARPRTGPSTIVVTFGPGGQPRARTYTPMDASAPPPEAR